MLKIQLPQGIQIRKIANQPGMVQPFISNFLKEFGFALIYMLSMQLNIVTLATNQFLLTLTVILLLLITVVGLILFT